MRGIGIPISQASTPFNGGSFVYGCLFTRVLRDLCRSTRTGMSRVISFGTAIAVTTAARASKKGSAVVICFCPALSF